MSRVHTQSHPGVIYHTWAPNRLFHQFWEVSDTHRYTHKNLVDRLGAICLFRLLQLALSDLSDKIAIALGYQALPCKKNTHGPILHVLGATVRRRTLVSFQGLTPPSPMSRVLTAESSIAAA